MTINNHIRHSNNTIKNAEKIQEISSEIFVKNFDNHASSNNMKELVELSKIMNKIIKTTDNAMRGAKLAESRVKARMIAVKKASAETIKYTARAKRAAIASKKATQVAQITSKKMQQCPQMKKLQTSYKIQIKGALTAAKESERNSVLALKSSKMARAAARVALEPKKI